MKKLLFFLLPAMLVIWSSATAQEPVPSLITYADASSVLQKTVGKWHVNKSTWHPEIRKMSDMEGTATHLSFPTDIAVQEQFEFIESDGTLHKEEGILRYSKVRQQFEFVTVDASTGKEIVLFTGHWHSNFKTILLKGMVRLKNRNVKLGEWRYIFLENGAFTKIIHYADKNGNLHFGHRYHYIPAPSATAELH